jgi:glycosyltransferase involved in cell wall biosynthesis
MLVDNRNKTPMVSVIIPCRNEVKHIEACVNSVLAQKAVKGGIEIIVADGMSTDGTRDILARLATGNPNLTVLDNSACIKPHGANAAIRAARGSYIAIMDAHHRYAEDYLHQAVAALNVTGVDNVGGAMYCEGEGYVQRAVAAAFHHPFSVGGALWHNPEYEGPADTVYGGVYRREVFDKIGLFDEDLVRNQDDELNLRLVRSGGRIWQTPKMKSWYSPRSSLKSLFKQYFQYGYWKVKVIRKHKLPASIRHLAPGLFVLSLLFLILFTIITSALPGVSTGGASAGIRFGAGMLLLLEAGIYLAVNLAASLHTAARSSLTLLPILPFVFACFHFGYGLGFLRGIWDVYIC